MRVCALCLAAVLASCTTFPELDSTRSAAVARAPYPGLVPLDPLLDGPAPRATVVGLDATLDRAAGLRARADRLRKARAGPGRIGPRLAQLRARAGALQSR